MFSSTIRSLSVALISADPKQKLCNGARDQNGSQVDFNPQRPPFGQDLARAALRMGTRGEWLVDKRRALPVAIVFLIVLPSFLTGCADLLVRFNQVR